MSSYTMETITVNQQETLTANEQKAIAYREEVIDHLTGNCDCEGQSKFNESDRDWLEDLDDAVLARLDDREATTNESEDEGAFERFIANSQPIRDQISGASRLSRQRTSESKQAPLVAPGLFDTDRQAFRLPTANASRPKSGHNEEPLIPVPWKF